MATIYEPLDKTTNEIRLMRIERKSDTDAIVTVEVFKRDLKTAVEDTFIPFSYVWGDQTQKHSIIVNGQTRQVGKNLASMLKQARSVILKKPLKNDPRKHGYLFWADALCIDQSNTDERNHQVSLMKDIYGSARLAIASVGEVPDCEKAIELMSCIYTRWYQKLDMDYVIGTPEQDAIDPDLNGWMSECPQFWKVDAEGFFGNSYWVALENLLQCPYWKRLWVHQEAVLPQKVVLMLGSTVVCLETTTVVAEWIDTLLNRCLDPIAPFHESVWFALTTSGYQLIYRLHSIKDARMRKGQMALDDMIMVVTNELGCTDERDYVFGFLGLLNTSIAPDYSLTMEKLGQIVSRRWTGRYLTCPSDVFSCATNTWLLPGIMADRIEAVSPLFTGYQQEVFTQLLTWTADRVDQDESVLAGSGASIFHALFYNLFLIQSFEVMKDPVKLHNMATAFVLLLLGHPPATLPHPTDLEMVNSTIQSSLRRLRFDSTRELIAACLGTPASTPSNSLQKNWDGDVVTEKNRFYMADVGRKMLFGLQKRNLFVTQKGLLGLYGSGDLATGDHVAVIAKCSVPIILRGRRRYSVVGPAFVVGLMNGELGQTDVRILEIK